MVLRIDNFNTKRITINFYYNNKWYNHVKLADIGLTTKCHQRVSKKGQLTLYNVLMLFSLVGAFQVDSKHYKLIANIIEKEDIVAYEVTEMIEEIGVSYDDDLPF